MNKPEKHSYHDLEIETAKIPRTPIFNLPHGLSVTCCRVTGWELWDGTRYHTSRPLAGEYSDNWLRLYVGDTVIVDSSPDLKEENGRLRGLLKRCEFELLTMRTLDLTSPSLEGATESTERDFWKLIKEIEKEVGDG